MIKRLEAKLVRFSQSFFYFLLWTVFFAIFLLFFKIKVDGYRNIPKKGRFILAANHQNFFDGFLIAYPRGPFKKIRFVIAKRALNLQIFQVLAKLIGAVLICNEQEEYQRVLKKLNSILSHGGVVGIFPEGNVSPNVLPRRFKGGVAKLSLDSQTRVVPVYISGTYNLRYFWYWLKRKEIRIKIGAPVDLYNYLDISGNNLEQMASSLREKVIELIESKEFEKFEKNENLNSSDYNLLASSVEPLERNS